MDRASEDTYSAPMGRWVRKGSSKGAGGVPNTTKPARRWRSVCYGIDRQYSFGLIQGQPLRTQEIRP